MGDTAKCPKCGRDIQADAPGGVCPACALGAAIPSSDPGPTAEEVAAKLPAFEILGVLGRGGMGVVFKARQKALDRIVALKVLPPTTAKTPGFADRFQREAKAMARLAHPNIVAVHESGESGGLFYLVLEFVDGLNVREAMAAGRIRPSEALTIVPQICDALQYAHDRGVVHRDIKPENVMIDREGRVRIADFGLAKLADRETGDPSLTAAGQVMGTLRYMAPEQWERPKEVDHRADIYSLGVVFYEMLTGELPMGKFEPPSSKAQIDVRIDDVVMRAIERDRERRWQHASDVRTRVGEIASGVAAAPPTAPVPTPTPRIAAQDVEAPSVVPIVVPFLVAVIAVVFTLIVHFREGYFLLLLLVAAASLIVGVVKTIRRREEMRRLGLVKPRSTPEEALAEKVRREKLIEEIETAAEPEPRGKWLPLHTTALVTLAALSAVALLCGGMNEDVGGMTMVNIGFWGGLALWTMCDSRKKAVREAEDGKRDAVGPPIAIDIVAAVLIVAGLFAFGRPIISRFWATDHAAASSSQSAVKPKKPADDRAPWEFEMSFAKDEDPNHVPTEADRKEIWELWAKAQALQGDAYSGQMIALYDYDQRDVVRAMEGSKIPADGSVGTLGLPAVPKKAADLSKFDVESVRFGTWLMNGAAGGFSTAVVRASDGEKTLRFSMRRRQNNSSWGFAVAPVEIR